MIATTISLTYLGAVLCYVASPTSASGMVPPILDETSPRVLRAGGMALLGLGLVLCVTQGPVGEGILVWLSMGMAAASLLVIAAPLVDRFVLVSTVLAFATAVLAPWV